ncbi:MAG: hypothetical protein AAF679_03745 [Pseudomonadota bacterium]
MTDTPFAAKRAEAAIRYFEDAGREVVGVTFKGSQYKIEFAKPEKDAVPAIDLVDMSQ